MYIPIWGLFTLGGVWIVSMLHMHRQGFNIGINVGTQEGIVATIRFFRINKMITESNEEILESIKKE